MGTTDQIQGAVDRLGASLGHAVLIEDPQHRPLWWSVQGEVDATRMRSILQRQVDPAATAVVARLGLAHALGPVRVPEAPEAEMKARWCIPLRSGRDLLGYLWVLDPEHTVGDAQLAEAIACAELAVDALLLGRLTMAERERRRSVLLRQLAAAADADAARELVHLEELDPRVLVSVNSPARPDGWALGDDLSVHAGDPSRTSGPPLPLLSLQLAVQRATQVRQALAAGATLTQPRWDCLGAWHLIVAAPAELSVADIHPGADALAALDRADLLTTARAVLEAGGEIAHVAEILHVHRTTLYYRIERIEALTGVDLKAGSDRDALLLALRLAAYRASA